MRCLAHCLTVEEETWVKPGRHAAAYGMGWEKFVNTYRYRKD